MPRRDHPANLPAPDDDEGGMRRMRAKDALRTTSWRMMPLRMTILSRYYPVCLRCDRRAGMMAWTADGDGFVCAGVSFPGCLRTQDEPPPRRAPSERTMPGHWNPN